MTADLKFTGSIGNTLRLFFREFGIIFVIYDFAWISHHLDV